ncbi:DUF1488 domain-containing protein [Photobacterium swingsii]|uniref:DUF1488 domain-containing protein n=1 Tax=Photobacterium swingsii TaxID=680026 RepID=A0A0J8V868_9GAMM|nr:DUF1488 domain-containing protein [Photobacterium swingsii]KMV29367.1 transcriptional regulator [Photobacterium swingsii]PSW20007.1 DUF1488 domain-containing protein [Photobacterium swingsii]
MNQDILFADIQTWHVERQAISFPAQQAGALIECWVSLSWLQQRTSNSLVSEADIVAAFIHLRFDLEELAEARIEDEDYEQDGSIFIG